MARSVDYDALREQMVATQLVDRGIHDPHVLRAMRSVPRHLFVSSEWLHSAYSDGPLPIDSGQTISQPYIVAFMIQAAEVRPGQRVLEVGAGSGYASAVLADIAAEVIAVERIAELARTAAARLLELGVSNVRILEGDGTEGRPEEAPFDAILVAAGGPAVPDTLRRQLKTGGRLVMPVGTADRSQRLVRVRRRCEDRFQEEDLGPVRFVTLIGRLGWETA